MKLALKACLCAFAAVAIAVAVPSAMAQAGAGKFAGAIKGTVRVLALQPDGKVDYGAGWIIAPADRENNAGAAVVITARHIIQGAVRVTVIEDGASADQQRVATVKTSTSERDIAFLNVRGLNEPALSLTRTTPNVGDPVNAFGFSGASDRGEDTQLASEASLKGGHLSRTRTARISSSAQAPVDQIEFDASILAGYSGGPLLNNDGEVIGITVQDGGHVLLGGGSQISLGQGVSIAVASDEIIAAAHDAGVPVKLHSEEAQQPIVQVPDCPGTGMSVNPANGQACRPIGETSSQPHFALDLRSILIGVVVLAAVVVAGIMIYIMRKPVRTPESDVYYGGGPQASGQTNGFAPRPSSARRLVLTGSGPAGEPINLSFTSDELIGEGCMLGAAPGGKIPDNRPEPYVSRRHARIYFDGQNFMVDDNKSMNMTKVGDQVITHGTPKSLMSGETLTLADIRLNVTVNSPS